MGDLDRPVFLRRHPCGEFEKSCPCCSHGTALRDSENALGGDLRELGDGEHIRAPLAEQQSPFDGLCRLTT